MGVDLDRRKDNIGLMRIAILDMGREIYGDCLYVDMKGFTVLIDGGHPGDYKGGADIPLQLKKLTNKSRHKFQLLVVTHSHNDHLGCLPELVADGIIAAEMALVSDPDNRYGPSSDHDALIDGLPPAGRAVLDLLGEELPDPTDANFAEALDKIVPVEPRYRAMMKRLKADGTKVVRYMTDPLKPITDFITPHGLTILGPTRAHIQLCAKRLQKEQDAAARRINDALARDATLSKADLFRIAYGGNDADALDASTKNKGAINNLSIVMVAEESGKKVLLPGDMQFADAEVDGLDGMMATLLKKVSQAGPYDAVKTSHHTSKNGWNEAMHRTLLKSPLLVHSGGTTDATHPEKGVLEMMERSKAGHTFLRTDRNGLIDIRLRNGKLEPKYSGSPNDFTPNPGSDAQAEELTVENVPNTSGARVTTTTAKGADIVRVTAEIPHTSTRVTITVDIAPQGSSAQSRTTPARIFSAPSPGSTGPIDGLNGLLFLTAEDRLVGKIGEQAVETLKENASRQDAGWSGELPGHFSSNEVKRVLEAELRDGQYKGVVLLGDYDVVPPARFDCLPPEVRAAISPSTDDPDNFVVWSDSPYGDRDNDGIQEVPVSRVPDGSSAEFFLRTLRRKSQPLASQFTLRNVNRPFADQVQAIMPGTSRGPLESRPARASDVDPQLLRGAYLYFMLHGSDFDADRFWGEEEDSYLEAVNVDRIPPDLNGAVVFAGCCWGALIGREPAYRVIGDEPPAGRTVKHSMALACLERGASAFVGCTGAHYSPLEKPFGYYGQPMHTHFWAAIANGQPPARALFEARQQYLRNMPHPTPNRRTSIDEVAIELKIYHQFTCLGLGW
jgi:beta-lactamase superfamily II metal-dependent hydrolase